MENKKIHLSEAKRSLKSIGTAEQSTSNPKKKKSLENRTDFNKYFTAEENGKDENFTPKNGDDTLGAREKTK